MTPRKIVGILPYLVKSQGNIASIIASIACIIASIAVHYRMHYCLALPCIIACIEGYSITIQFDLHQETDTIILLPAIQNNPDQHPAFRCRDTDHHDLSAKQGKEALFRLSIPDSSHVLLQPYPSANPSVKSPVSSRSFF
jgi:hypothetical protein